MIDTMSITQQAAASAEAPKLNTFREQIDTVDIQILALLNQRVAIVHRIGELKKQKGLPIYVPDREEKLLRHLVEKNSGALSATSVRAIYREIISACRALEKEIVVACFGVVTGITYRAAYHRFGSTVRYIFCKSASELFKRVAKNEADCGVIAIQASEIRRAVQVLSELSKTELSVCAEISLDSHNKKCRDRFLVLSRTPSSPSGLDCTLILLRLENKSGALASVLEPFQERSINLLHLASQPPVSKRSRKDRFFFMEAEGHSMQLQANNCLRELSKRCRDVRILGSYPMIRTC